MREDAYSVIKQSNMIMLKIIKKLLKMHNFNALIEVSFIHIIIKNNSDLKVKDIKCKSTSAETFAVRADIQ
jgi:hypothetical protein